jgi:hypothetical protein
LFRRSFFEAMIELYDLVHLIFPEPWESKPYGNAWVPLER